MAVKTRVPSHLVLVELDTYVPNMRTQPPQVPSLVFKLLGCRWSVAELLFAFQPRFAASRLSKTGSGISLKHTLVFIAAWTITMEKHYMYFPGITIRLKPNMLH
jgi:hypothetical protein